MRFLFSCGTGLDRFAAGEVVGGWMLDVEAASPVESGGLGTMGDVSNNEMGVLEMRKAMGLVMSFRSL